jgi:hypothetical protein
MPKLLHQQKGGTGTPITSTWLEYRVIFLAACTGAHVQISDHTFHCYAFTEPETDGHDQNVCRVYMEDHIHTQYGCE